MDLGLLFRKLICIDGLDIWEGLSRVRCNRQAYADNLRLFCEDAAAQTAALGAALEGEVWQACAQAAHALKGILAGIGAWELSRMALALEESLRRGDREACHSGTGPALEEITGFIAAVRGALSAAGEKTKIRQRASVDFLEEKLGMLQRACSAGASREADSLAGELRARTFDDPATDAFVEKLSVYVENLDYDLALKSIEDRLPKQEVAV
ncbi:MAG: Hpt domain-containing protein [Spirochaetaceae bacterium]|nr:Hpt domain-containing protein [Spirochaetaceae bacterium]